MRLWPLAVMLLAILTEYGLSAADWPAWRGPLRNGHTSESSGWPAKDWPAAKPVWRGQFGVGASSPLVVGEQVFILGHANGSDTVTCLGLADGQRIWSAKYTASEYGRFHEGDEGLYSGPSSTPEYDPATRFLYTLGADGHLACWDTGKKGAAIWHRNLYDGYSVARRPKLTRAPRRDYGYTSSPLVHGELLLVEVGSTAHGTIVAFEKRTGNQVWASELKDEAGHTGGPAPILVEGIPCIAVVTQRNLAVIRLDPGNEGKTVGLFPWVTDFANSIASPAVQGDSVLVTSAYNQNAMCRVRVTLAGLREVWRVPFPSKVCTPVIHQGNIYVAWQKVRCLSWETGKLQWEGGTVGDPGSCILTGDERLIVYGKNGKLMLVETAKRSPSKCQELAVKDGIFSALAWPHVVLAGGRILCRDREGHLACFEVSKK